MVKRVSELGEPGSIAEEMSGISAGAKQQREPEPMPPPLPGKRVNQVEDTGY
jgi:hypothetical protein